MSVRLFQSGLRNSAGLLTSACGLAARSTAHRRRRRHRRHLAAAAAAAAAAALPRYTIRYKFLALTV
jgi:hypothetical protein